jgi:hypothetical protein
MHTRFWSGSLKGRDHLQELSVDGKIKFKWISWKQVSVDWIHLAKERDQWQVFVNTIMNFLGVQNAPIS